MSLKAISGVDLLQIVEVVASEKGIDPESIFSALEVSLSKAGRANYGAEMEIECHISRDTGEVAVQSKRMIVENGAIEDAVHEIELMDAQIRNPQAKVGEYLIQKLPPLDLGRISAQSARQIIMQRIQEAEKSEQYEAFKDKEGDIVYGVVKRVDPGFTILQLGKAEGFLSRKEMIPRESFHVGERVKCYVYEVRKETTSNAPQVLLSRTHPIFLAKLFAQEVPEIREGKILVKAVSRNPGSRAKLAVVSLDPSIEPVGACVGLRGDRVHAVSTELRGEKVDIIRWSEDLATFVMNACSNFELSRVVIDEAGKKVQIIVPESSLSLAIGAKGQNVRLLAQLLRHTVEIAGEEEYQKRAEKKRIQIMELWQDALDVDEDIADVLYQEGYMDLNDLVKANLEDLALIEGFDEDIAEELVYRAQERALLIQKEKEAKALADSQIGSLSGMTYALLQALQQVNLSRLRDLAELSVFDLEDELGENHGFEHDLLSEVILQARKALN